MASKKVFYAIAIFFVVILCLCVALSTNTNKNKVDSSKNIIEKMISTDMAYMDTINGGDYTFFESRLELADPFNESNKIDIAEVTNVFQFLVTDSLGEITPNVYMFIHDAVGSTIVEKHEGAFMVSDIAVDMNSVKINFNKAFELAKQSNYAPSKSRFITLRHGFGPNPCNPFYTIGNDEYGHLWVDAINGTVYDKDPTTINK